MPFPADSPEAGISANPRFESPSLLGKGAFGGVYRARDLTLGTDVAVKALGNLSPEGVARLKSEFRAAAALSHRNLVQLYELFVIDGSAHFSMELVDGIDFVSAARGLDPAGGAFPELVRQLCSGLACLHENGLVHRDIKPANVLVTEAGRVVVVDFGFLQDDRALAATPAIPEGLVGTFAYMAPEQLRGERAGGAADVYAAGAMLHEVLTGAPPRPWTGGSTVPIGLRADDSDPLHGLVARMLDIDPQARPDLRSLASRAGDGIFHRRPAVATAQPFVGRGNEQEWLWSRVTDASRARVLEIHGPSGVGKTELVRHVLGRLSHSRAVVLHSRCRIAESVPFQALDSAIDELSVEVARMAGTDSTPALEHHASIASTLFPVLARVPDVAPPNVDSSLDPIELRRHASTSLRELLVGLGEERSIVLWIDDAQWADEDSATLLEEMSAGFERASSVTVILTTRSAGGESSSLGASLERAAGQHAAFLYERRAIGPLGVEDSEELVRALSGHRELTAESLNSIVRASKGSPFLLTSFAAVLGSGRAADRAAEGFSAVLRQTIADLQHEERLLLELVALCRHPTSQEWVLEAADIGPRGIPAIQKLERRRLIRLSPGHGSIGRGRVLVDPYHDQVPETLLGWLEPATLRSGHARLARVHEAHGSEPAVLSHHFHGAGDLPAASAYAELAGRRADSALAFVAAAEFYRSASTWHRGGSPSRLSTLLELEGAALANAGSLATAGERYVEASRAVSGLTSLELRRRAVESLLAGGRMDEAVVELRELLGKFGMAYPRTELAAFTGAVAALLRYLITRRLPRRGNPDAIEMLRIDSCYASGRRLADVDPSRGTYFLALSLARAERAGDPFRLARSLCSAGGALGAVAGRTINRIGDSLMNQAARIADDLASDELHGMIDIAYGEIFMLKGHWRAALERSRRGVRRLERKPGFVFECDTGRCAELRVLEELGRVDEGHAAANALLESARLHHNAYIEIRAAQHVTVALIGRGRTAEAREYIRVGSDWWRDDAFQLQRFVAVRNEALCDLYDGDAERGLALLDSIEHRFRRSVIGQIPLLRIDLNGLRGQLAVSLAAQGSHGASLEIARKAAAALRSERREDARIRALLLQAGIQAKDDPRIAAATAREAELAADAIEMKSLAASAAWRRRSWTGDAEGAARELERLASQGVGAPARFAAMVVPALAP